MMQCALPPDLFASRLPHQLSGGQRQRAAIARAIAASQDVLLLDEAFGALDAISRDDMLERVAALLAELRPTTVFVTHDLGEAARLADTVAVVRAGCIEQCAPMAELRRAPATRYVADLLARAEAVAHRVLGP
jgi:ABC-type proline/glycine betaine transport system ATPase subunit